MRKNIEQIDIQEPPIQEITKKKSCARRSCTTGCGCIVIFLIVAVVLLNFTTGPRAKTLKKIPENFPKSIPIYDQDNISNITFISGKEKNKIIETIALIPKLILSPIILVLNNNLNNDRQLDDNGRIQINKTTGWKEWLNIIKEPITDNRDIIQIEWTELSAEPKFVYNYYKNELEKKTFIIEQETYNNERKEFHFKLNELDGILYIKDNSESNGTDFISMTINIPRAK